MTKVIVEIELGNHVTARDIRLIPDWIVGKQDGEYIVIDEAFLHRNEDDSFFDFKLVEIVE